MSELENIKVVLNYLNTIKDGDSYKQNPPSFNEWLESEKERLNKEYHRTHYFDDEKNEWIEKEQMNEM